jgi:N-acetylmuramoyl-L-alanine amidase
MPTLELSLDRLCDPLSKVSAHYLVSEDGLIYQLVGEDRRAWHAGKASWAGIEDVNSASIGIEIQNAGHDHGYPDFAEKQMDQVALLCRDVVQRNQIRSECVLAHSDVAPARKIDPGEKFNWRRLHVAGVGHWVEEATAMDDKDLRPGDQDAAVSELQRLLVQYGYALDVSGKYDLATTDVVRAFQRHFRQSRVDGVADAVTFATLTQLIAAIPPDPAGTS